MTLPEQMDLSGGRAAEAAEIAHKLHQKGFTAYFAGGCVRDFLMGKEPQDFDIATSAQPDQIESIFPRTVPVGKQFGVILVIGHDSQYYEVATFRKEGKYEDGRRPTEVEFSGPHEDAKRRDFTINGMFYDPVSMQVMDFVGGKSDIEKRVVRAIGDAYERFEEDKLRLLRAVRFASSLDFEIEEVTWQALKGEAGKITCVSAERIRDEIVKTLVRPGARRAIQLLFESGLLESVLPEIAGLHQKRNTPGFSPEKDLLATTAVLVGRLSEPSEIGALAALFYYWDGEDALESDGETGPFFSQGKHNRFTKVAEVLKRLKASNDTIDGVLEVLKNQHRFEQVQEMREGVLKMFIARKSFALEFELYSLYCRQAGEGKDNCRFLNEKIKSYSSEDLAPPPFLSGHDLIELGLDPGPKMKPVLDEAYLLQLEGRHKNREEALIWAREQVC